VVGVSDASVAKGKRQTHHNGQTNSCRDKPKATVAFKQVQIEPPLIFCFRLTEDKGVSSKRRKQI
jgi:hypothetical protein